MSLGVAFGVRPETLSLTFATHAGIGSGEVPRELVLGRVLFAQNAWARCRMTLPWPWSAFQKLRAGVWKQAFHSSMVQGPSVLNNTPNTTIYLWSD